MDEISEWFEDEGNMGIASIQEAVELTDLPETFVRAYCRREGLRRVGSVYVLGEDDVRDLIAEADDEGDLEDEDDSTDSDDGDAAEVDEDTEEED